MPLTEENKNKLNRILDMYGVDEELRKFYYSREYEDEVVIDKYTFYSIKNIIEEYEDVEKENISKQFEICYTMIGMGHTCVLVYDPRVQKYLFRHGGGSSGVDNYYIMKYFEDEFDPNNPEFRTYLFNFNDAINKIIYGLTGSHMIMDF